jgi:hypothetical protein
VGFVSAGLALLGAFAGSLLPGHGDESEVVVGAAATPALETENGT